MSLNIENTNIEHTNKSNNQYIVVFIILIIIIFLVRNIMKTNSNILDLPYNGRGKFLCFAEFKDSKIEVSAEVCIKTNNILFTVYRDGRAFKTNHTHNRLLKYLENSSSIIKHKVPDVNGFYNITHIKGCGEILKEIAMYSFLHFPKFNGSFCVGKDTVRRFHIDCGENNLVIYENVIHGNGKQILAYNKEDAQYIEFIKSLKSDNIDVTKSFMYFENMNNTKKYLKKMIVNAKIIENSQELYCAGLPYDRDGNFFGHIYLENNQQINVSINELYIDKLIVNLFHNQELVDCLDDYAEPYEDKILLLIKQNVKTLKNGPFYDLSNIKELSTIFINILSNYNNKIKPLI